MGKHEQIKKEEILDLLKKTQFLLDSQKCLLESAKDLKKSSLQLLILGAILLIAITTSKSILNTQISIFDVVGISLCLININQQIMDIIKVRVDISTTEFEISLLEKRKVEYNEILKELSKDK